MTFKEKVLEKTQRCYQHLFFLGKEQCISSPVGGNRVIRLKKQARVFKIKTNHNILNMETISSTLLMLFTKKLRSATEGT